MAPIKLNDNKIIQLLEVYEKCACLWDAKLESYKNKQARDEAYNTMLETLRVPGLTVRELRNKIKSIRSTYIQEFRKLTQYIAKYGNEYAPRLVWFSRADAFLRQVYVPRKDILDGTPIVKEIDYDDYINVKGKPDNTATENANDFSDNHFDDNSTNNMQMPLDDLYQNQNTTNNCGEVVEQDVLVSDTIQSEINLPCNNLQQPSTSTNNKQIPKLHQNHIPKRKTTLDDNAKRRKQTNDVMPWNLMEPLKKRKKHTSNNEFDLFATFIEVQLQKLPVHLALRCQNSIQVMLTDERLRIYEESRNKNTLNEMPNSSMHNYSLPERGNSSKNDSCFVAVKS